MKLALSKSPLGNHASLQRMTVNKITTKSTLYPAYDFNIMNLYIHTYLIHGELRDHCHDTSCRFFDLTLNTVDLEWKLFTLTCNPSIVS